jgi:rubrerythrin
MARRMYAVQYSRMIPVLLLTVLMFIAVSHAGSTGNHSISAGSTADNVRLAYQSEMRAHDQYVGCADKADDEGYHQIATMFRAIARGEEIHAALLRDLAGKLSVELPAATSQTLVLSTPENLKSAVDDQAFERDELYPQFIKIAKKEKQRDAQQLFERIVNAEPKHLVWYRQALHNPELYTAAGAQFYVCPVCGAVERSSRNTCGCCGTSSLHFEIIS